jgi:hypothetical protein
MKPKKRRRLKSDVDYTKAHGAGVPTAEPAPEPQSPGSGAPSAVPPVVQTTNSALIAILAAVLDPEAFKDNAGPAIRRAERIVRAVPQYLSGKNPNLREAFEVFKPELEFRSNEARKWGFSEPWSIVFLNTRNSNSLKERCILKMQLGTKLSKVTKPFRV